MFTSIIHGRSPGKLTNTLMTQAITLNIVTGYKKMLESGQARGGRGPGKA